MSAIITPRTMESYGGTFTEGATRIVSTRLLGLPEDIPPDQDATITPAAVTGAAVVGGTVTASALASPVAVVGASVIGATASVPDQLPTTPTGVGSTALRPTEADLFWTGSTDDVGVVGYEIVVTPL